MEVTVIVRVTIHWKLLGSRSVGVQSFSLCRRHLMHATLIYCNLSLLHQAMDAFLCWRRNVLEVISPSKSKCVRRTRKFKLTVNSSILVLFLFKSFSIFSHLNLIKICLKRKTGGGCNAAQSNGQSSCSEKPSTLVQRFGAEKKDTKGNRSTGI